MTGTSRALKLAKARVMGRTTNAAAAAAPAAGRQTARPMAERSGGVAALRRTAGRRQTKSCRPKTSMTAAVVQKMPQGWWQ